MSLTIDQLKEVTAHNEGVWNRCAPTSAEVFEPFTSGATTPLLDLAGVGRNTILLDIGTGPGTLIGPALERGAHVDAIDLAPEMVAATPIPVIRTSTSLSATRPRCPSRTTRTTR